MNYKKVISDRFKPQSKHTSATTVALALVGGIAVGAIVSLLFAPQSGEETRGLIADKTKDLAGNMKDTLKSVAGRLRNGAENHANHIKDGLTAES